jgi:ATPases with chaperone activity, ATP-binding subunit
MFGNFTEETRKIIVTAKKEMSDLKHPYIGSEHLLLSILKNKNEVSEKLKKYNIFYDNIKEEIINILGKGKEKNDYFLYTPLLKRVFENAIMDSKENNNGNVTVWHLFSGLLEEGEGVAIRIMMSMNINLDELYNDFSYKLINTKSNKEEKLLLDEIGTDLTKRAKSGKTDPVVGREKEIKRCLEILSRRTKNNPVLIGSAGVGKTAIAEEIARKIVNEEVPNSLKNKRIISLDMGGVVAGTKYRGEFEDRMKKILKEIENNDNIILFIDEIHTLVGAGGAEGAIDASNIFKPALARGKLKIIGATTTDEFKKYIEEDGALERRFQKVFVEIPSKEIVFKIISKLKPLYENFHKVKISNENLKKIVSLSEKYIYDRNEPDRSIDVMDEVCAKVSLKETKNIKKYNDYNKELKEIIKEKNDAIVNQKFNIAFKLKTKENTLLTKLNNLSIDSDNDKDKKEVSINDIAEVINIKTNIPVYEILNDNYNQIKSMEKELKNNIIGQDIAIKQVIKIAKLVKMGFTDKHACYSIILAGPTGTGKTHLAKIFGKALVGERNVIKMDMSEYRERHSISKILGAPPGYVGYKDHTNILEEIRNKPHSVLIVDEIEKAHPSIIDLFYQILDDNKIKDSNGKIVRFDHVTILMTSNIGFHDIKVGFSKNENTSTKMKESFSLPFINRVDNIVKFNQLKKDNVKVIIENKIEKLKEKFYKKEIEITINKNVVKELIDLSEYETYGARKIDKIIKDKLGDLILERLLNGEKNIILDSIIEKIL